MTKVLGIDPSTSCIGMVTLEADAKNLHLVEAAELAFSKGNKNSLSHHERQVKLISLLEERIAATEPDLIVVEGYGINMRRPGSIIPLVEMGGVLRYHLRSRQYAWIEPKPTVVKQYVTGSGAAKKPVVQAAMRTLFPELVELGEDASDAAACAYVGIGFMGKGTRLSVAQHEIISQISLC